MKTFFSEWRYHPRLCFQTGSEAEHAAVMLKVLLHAEWEMRSGRGTDYFVETGELADLICGMVKDYSADILDVFSETRRSTFIVHPPSPRPAILVSILTDADGTAAVLFKENGVRKSERELTQLYLGPACFKDKQVLTAETYQEKLAIGLALYMRFFPKAVRDGLPQIAKHPSHYKGSRCASVSLSPELVNRSGPKPHIRKCHFRFLSSEKFIHKQGQYVLVKETFIKGKAKIVVEVE